MNGHKSVRDIGLDGDLHLLRTRMTLLERREKQLTEQLRSLADYWHLEWGLDRAATNDEVFAYIVREKCGSCGK